MNYNCNTLRSNVNKVFIFVTKVFIHVVFLKLLHHSTNYCREPEEMCCCNSLCLSQRITIIFKFFPKSK